MKKWWLKALVQKAISVLPFGFRINYLFQRYITRRVRLNKVFLETMQDHFEEAVRYWSDHGKSVRGSHIIELGTGWHAVLPVLAFLSGAASVTTIDLRPLVRRENLRELLEYLLTLDDVAKTRASLLPERLEMLREILNECEETDIATTLEKLHIRQWIGNAEDLSFETGRFDLCWSVNVLEHVDADALPAILDELKRVTRPGGLHYHAVGTYDHFVHIDPSISKFNYLRFSKSGWKRIDNSIQPQNRLRISWFRDHFREMDLDILETLLWDAEPAELEKVPLHPDFRDLDLADVPYGTFILRKPA